MMIQKERIESFTSLQFILAELEACAQWSSILIKNGVIIITTHQGEEIGLS